MSFNSVVTAVTPTSPLNKKNKTNFGLEFWKKLASKQKEADPERHESKEYLQQHTEGWEDL